MLFATLRFALAGIMALATFFIVSRSEMDVSSLSAAAFAALFGLMGYATLHLKGRLDVLQMEADRFFLAVRGTNEGIWDWEIGAKGCFYSPRFKELLGYAEHEFEDALSSFESHIHPEDHDLLWQTVNNHIEHNTPFDTKYRLRAKSGEYYWFHARGQVLRDANGRALRVAGSIRNITERQQMQESLRESASVLVSSALQLLASTAQLAASAAQTAGAVRQTAATTLEIRQSADACQLKATEIAQAAKLSVTISHAGDRAVQDTLKGMQHVREQMAAIAARVAQLGEQSQQVGEIIATVEELAEQSNILAVNAAIEAAKAGDRGKGFAVVAQEVRHLAEQSQRATTQVRGVLADIQHATTAAVGATESGTALVTAGAEQSTETAGMIRRLAQTIEEAAQEAGHIVLSNQQQATGMEQITIAMESIKAASSQNVDGVKQVEQVARHLRELGERLQEEINRYNSPQTH